MEITATVDGARATIAVVGTIDTRASSDFESEMLKAVQAGAKQVIVDFAKLDLVTSAGIRVLVMMAKRLKGSGGGLVLCSLSADVRRVFDISGLTSQFRIAATRADAMAALAQADAPKSKSSGSRISQAVKVLLGGRARTSIAAAPGGPGERSSLSAHVIGLLGDKTKPPRK